MSVLSFQSITVSDKTVGGKAWGLARLSSAGFPVPEGMILTTRPGEDDFRVIGDWWREHGHRPLAVRSSAAAEDSAETSFAGQNQSFLNVTSEAALRDAVAACFASGDRASSQAYRRHFTGVDGESAMNVVIQEMVDARFSGVFFSRDPRTGGEWLLEVIHGLGEDLVSGRINPGRVRGDGSTERLPKGFSLEDARAVAETGRQVAASLGFDVDMEWAFDAQGRLRVLQARPITTHAAPAVDPLIQEELDRLTSTYPPRTTWDGQTFAEWNGAVSPFTFSLWRAAFSPHHAFGNALRALGYQGFDARTFGAGESLLQDVFGRAYVNLDRLSDLYYGPIPYAIEARPRPHTRFDGSKISPGMIAHMPSALWSMMKVAWNVSSRRRVWMSMSAAALNRQKERCARPENPRAHQGLSLESLRDLLREETRAFSTETLHWPLLLVVLTESTIQNLRLILKGVVGEADADRLLREWMAAGLHTVTRDMMDEMKVATVDAKRRPAFLARFGHRGPGEMDLARPRWVEMGDAAFQGRGFAASAPARSRDVEAEIARLRTFKRDVIRDEWRLFRALLEHREQWKMELLKPYAHIRYLLLELGRRTGLEEKILWLEVDEALSLTESSVPSVLTERIEIRRRRQEAFRAVGLPEILSLSSLEDLTKSPDVEGRGAVTGEPLSPGLVCGQIRYVEDPSKIRRRST